MIGDPVFTIWIYYVSNLIDMIFSLYNIFNVLISTSWAHLIFLFVMQNKNDNLSDRLAHEFHSVQLDGA